MGDRLGILSAVGLLLTENANIIYIYTYKVNCFVSKGPITLFLSLSLSIYLLNTYINICLCLSLFIYIYIYMYIHTHTHTLINTWSEVAWAESYTFIHIRTAQWTHWQDLGVVFYFQNSHILFYKMAILGPNLCRFDNTCASSVIKQQLFEVCIICSLETMRTGSLLL